MDKLSIKYIVIEDEPLARRGLVKLLKDYDLLDEMTTSSNKVCDRSVRLGA